MLEFDNMRSASLWRHSATKYTELAMASKKTHHVVKNPSGGWAVKKGGASRASGSFKTQKAAVSSAKKISKNQGTRVVIHGQDGRIKKK